MGDCVEPSPTYTSIFEQVFPYALSIGMSYNQYWSEDPSLYKYYFKAEEIRKQRENNYAYLQGFYVYQAIGSYAEIIPAFPRKGAKIQPYLEKPIPLTKEDAEKEEARKERERVERIKERMLKFADKFNGAKQ